MQAKFIRSTLFLAGTVLFLSLAACAPKCIINGRVVDAETEHPIKGAAVAIRWVEDQPEANSATSQSFDSAQDFSALNRTRGLQCFIGDWKALPNPLMGASNIVVAINIFEQDTS